MRLFWLVVDLRHWQFEFKPLVRDFRLCSTLTILFYYGNENRRRLVLPRFDSGGLAVRVELKIVEPSETNGSTTQVQLKVESSRLWMTWSRLSHDSCRIWLLSCILTFFAHLHPFLHPIIIFSVVEAIFCYTTWTCWQLRLLVVGDSDKFMRFVLKNFYSHLPHKLCTNFSFSFQYS